MNKLTLSLIATFAYNTAIAGLLTATGWMAESCGFGCNFVFSQSIGLSIAIISSLTLARMPAGWLRWAALAVVLPLSVSEAQQIHAVNVGLRTSTQLTC
jgi:hypothetical protein